MTPFLPRCVLVTGGAGFIGSNFIRAGLKRSDLTVVNLDALTYAGNTENLASVAEQNGGTGDGRYYFVKGDVRDEGLLKSLFAGDAVESLVDATPRKVPIPDSVVHFAAESHVDRSLDDPGAFVDTNVRGTQVLLDACAGLKNFRFIHVSTDEVYGSLGPDDPAFRETTLLSPNSPYSASKAGSDLLVRAYTKTFGLSAIITRCSNNYGPYQFPEKLIPLMVTRAYRDEVLPVYGDGRNMRDWIFVDDHVEALWSILEKGSEGEIYNIGGGSEIANIELVRLILDVMGKPDSLIEFVTDRPGHDRRYAIDYSKLNRELGWKPATEFSTGIEQTIEWYLANSGWWERVINEAYRVTNSRYI